MERKETVRAALGQFMSHHLPETSIQDIDDIVLDYIVGILEDLGTEDSFDVEGFVEMMKAYIPGFAELSNDKVCKWMFELADLPCKEKENTPPGIRKVKGDDCLPGVGLVPSATGQVRGTLDERLIEDNVEDDQTDQACGGQVEESEDAQIRLLLEMFPSSCVVEAQKCLTIAHGDMEHATQLMLDRQMDDTYATTHQEIVDKQVRVLLEIFPSAHKRDVVKCLAQAQGNMDKAARLMLLDQAETTMSAYNMKTRQPAHKDDKLLKASILDKYAYVDTDEDRREHRPIAPKETKKKMVRYINNQAVTTRGERFVEIKKPESEEMKKTYVNLKPGRKYRFH